MSKQIALRMALTGLCALMIGLAGCSSQPADPGPPKGAPPPVPASVLNQMKSMPPEAQKQIQAQMQNTPQGSQINQTLQNGGTQSATPPASSGGGQ